MSDKEKKFTPLVKGIEEDTQSKATKLVVAGNKEGKSDDDIKQSIFGLGVPFSKLGRLFNAIMKAEGLSVDVAALKKDINAKIKASKVSMESTYAQLKELADAIVENTDKATLPRVIAQLKVYFKENETEFPRKPAPVRGRMGVINKTLIDTFKANPKASAKELEAELVKVTKTPKNAADYTKTHWATCYAIANGLSALEVQTVIAEAKAS